MENITTYIQNEKRSFNEYALTDVDLLAFSALLYAEFERFDHFMDPNSSTRIGDLFDYGTAHEYMEHDCNPAGMEPLIEALVESPRFCDVHIEHFACVVSETPNPIQFGAACFCIEDGPVIVAFRGTDTKLIGWQEDLEMTWRKAIPGQMEAKLYLADAARAYPDARLTVCGHSKGGSEAEYAVLFADNGASDNDSAADNANDTVDVVAHVDRVVSFDGPSLFKRAEKTIPYLSLYEDDVIKQYRSTSVPIVRYIFPAMLGLLLEQRNPKNFIYIKGINEKLQHNVCSAGIEDGAFVTWEPSQADLATSQKISDAISRLTFDERRFATSYIVSSCASENISIDLSDQGLDLIQKALRKHYRDIRLRDRHLAHSIMRKLAIHL